MVIVYPHQIPQLGASMQLSMELEDNDPCPLPPLPLHVERQIELDLSRTFCGNESVAERMDVIREMLWQHCGKDEELGYVQGMNIVAAVFAVSAREKSMACIRFADFVHSVRGLWLPEFPLFQSGGARFTKLAVSRPWFRHLSRHVDIDMYLPQAWMALFATWLPLATVVQCIGLLEEHGFDGMLALTLAILDRAGPALLAQRDLEGFLEVLTSIPEAPWASVAHNLRRAAIDWLPSVSCPQNPPLPVSVVEHDRRESANVGQRLRTLVSAIVSNALQSDRSDNIVVSKLLGECTDNDLLLDYPTYQTLEDFLLPNLVDRNKMFL